MSNPKTSAVELAYPLTYNGTDYEPNQTVELPHDNARQLVQDGRARWPGQQSERPRPAQKQPARKTTTAGVAGTEGGVTGG